MKKKMTLVHNFPDYLKPILPQSASFSHAGTQIVKRPLLGNSLSNASTNLYSVQL